jgi:hypothetical protein
MKSKAKSLMTWALSVGLLCGATAEVMSYGKPQDAEPFHAHVREVFAGLPKKVGDWVAEDIELPAAAGKLLRPNVLLNRRFTNVLTGRVVDFLLVQCRDARDMVGHYPPNCYPGNGWQLNAAGEKTWSADGLSITGTEYKFLKPGFLGEHPLYAANFMIIPGEGFAPDMGGVQARANDPRRRVFGAAQVHVVFSGEVPAAERDEVVGLMLRANAAVIKAIRDGEGQ